MNTLVWKDIPGYDGYYKISNMGEVFSIKRNKKLSISDDGNGYINVSLNKNAVGRTFRLHRLVMLTFVGPSKLTVNHKDGNKYNNCLDNLEYMTQRENNRHALRTGLTKSMQGEGSYSHKLTEKDVVEIKQALKDGKSGKFLSSKYNISGGIISRILHNRIWKHVKV